MISHIINLLVGFLAILYGFTIAVLSIRQKPYNFYLFFILILTGSVRIVDAFIKLELTHFTNPYRSLTTAAFIHLIIFYLFLSKILKNEGVQVKDIYALLPAIIIILLSEIFEFKRLYVYVFMFAGTLLLADLVKMTWSKYRKNIISIVEQRQLKEIKIFYFLFLAHTFYIFSFLCLPFFNDIYEYNKIIDLFYTYSGYSWLIILVYMFYNPSLVFGDIFLSKDSQKIKLKYDFNIWNFSSKKIVQLDNNIHEKLKLKITEIIIKINNIDSSIRLKNIEELSLYIGIPKSHLKHIFKYNCNYSVLDFLNLRKIIFSLILIEDGFLNKNTIESLANKSGFVSRTTFHLNFKKFVGNTVSDHLKFL